MSVYYVNSGASGAYSGITWAVEVIQIMAHQ